MYNKKKAKTFCRTTLAASIAVALSSGVTYAQDGTDVEEIVITGSFIRGTPLDAPSPVQVVDRDAIEAQGAALVWDVIKNLGVNSGSFAEGGSGEVTGTIGTAQVNLRNLGENSTLTLVNGKRLVPSAALTHSGGEFVDLNSVPLVMTERVEVLTDGGSALYGADAVAGVVNVIMRTDFEGLEVYGDLQKVQKADDVYDSTVSAIWGWATEDDNTHFVLSGERFDRDLLPATDGNFYDDSTTLITGNVSALGAPITSAAFGARPNPAYFNNGLRDRNLAEWSTPSTVYSDPLCKSGLTDESGNEFFILGEHPLQRGALGLRSGACVVDESQWAALSYDTKRDSVAGSFDHTFENGTEFYSFFQASQQETIRSSSGYARSFSNFFLPSPGAYSNAAGNVFELGHYAPMFGRARPTNITSNPTDLINGGPNVAHYTSLAYGNTRPGNDENRNNSESQSVQMGLKGELQIAERTLEWDLSYSAGSSSSEKRVREFSRQRAHLASVGLGGEGCVPNGVPNFDFVKQPAPNGWGPYASYYRFIFEGFFAQPYEPISYALTSNNHGQGNCKFYNPFLTSMTKANVANSDELLNWISQVHLNDDRRNKLGVWDATVTGALFELSGGTAAFAAGAQRRERNAKSRSSSLSAGYENAIVAYQNGVVSERGWIDNNLSCASCTSTYDLDQNTNALFLELSLPFIENVESQVALRWEDYGGAIGDEISPKLAMSWRPMEELLVRGSWSQSFRAPNPGIIGDGLDSSSATFLDPLKNQAVRAGLLPPTIANARLASTFTLGAPAPNVGNEYADTFSTGFLWTPGGRLEGLHLQADFWRFEVEDRVLPETAGSAMSRQVAAFQGAASNPANYILNTSLDTAAAQLYVACDPNALSAQYGANSSQRLNCVVDPRKYQVTGVEESLLAPNRGLIQLRLSAINAGEITSDGVDIKTGYRWENDWGSFGVNLDYTFVSQYTLSNVPGMDNGLLDVGIYDAAGTTGDGNLVRSLPDHKALLTMSWNRGNHAVSAVGHYTGSYEDITVEQRLKDPQFNAFARSLLSATIDAYDSWDLQYRYTHAWANTSLGTTVVTAGVLDVFNAKLPYREPVSVFDSISLNYDGTVFDPRGRRLYVRALWQF